MEPSIFCDYESNGWSEGVSPLGPRQHVLPAPSEWWRRVFTVSLPLSPAEAERCQAGYTTRSKSPCGRSPISGLNAIGRVYQPHPRLQAPGPKRRVPGFAGKSYDRSIWPDVEQHYMATTATWLIVIGFVLLTAGFVLRLVIMMRSSDATAPD